MRLGLRRPSGAWSKGRQTGSQAQGWHGFTLRISLSVLKAMGSHSGMLRKGGMQTDSGLELIMLGGGWRGRPVGRERVRASLDQGDGKYRKKDTGSRETRAVKQSLVLGPERGCEGDGRRLPGRGLSICVMVPLEEVGTLAMPQSWEDPSSTGAHWA